MFFLLAKNVFAQWKQHESIPLTSNIPSIFVDGNYVYAGADSIIYLSDDYGKNWTTSSRIAEDVDFVSAVTKYQNKILNIHPALLPKFGGKGMYGMNVHKAVIESGETKSGVTVHLVDEFYDNGRILHQVEVPVLPDDTPETLQKRVLAVEHKVYVETLKKIINGTIIL
jgi:hypothetical protein